MKPSRAFIILSLALVGVLCLSPGVLAQCTTPCPWNCNPDICCIACAAGGFGLLMCCCCPEFTPVTAALALAGIGGIAYLMRKRLAKAPKAH